MTKATRFALVIAAVLALAGSAVAGGGGTGAYEWRLSFSNSDATVQTGADFPAPGLAHLFLWYQGCNAAVPPGGMAAADFAVIPSGGWSFVGFSPLNGYLNAGSGANLLLAVGGCPTGPVLAGDISLFVVGAGACRLGLSNNAIAVTVDCANPTPAPWSWPDQVLFMGAKSTGSAATLQAWGNGCTVNSVESATWGGMKSLYR